MSADATHIGQGFADAAAGGSLRVLLLPPMSRDGQAISKALSAAGIEFLVTRSIASLCDAVHEGAGVVVIGEEFVAEGGDALSACLDLQPVWSDLPLLILSGSGVESERLTASLARLGNVSVVERSVRVNTLLSLVRSSLRARGRQYEVRAHLANLEAVGQALREREDRFRALTVASSDVLYRVSADWSVLLPLDGRAMIASNDEPIRDWMTRNVPPDEHARVRAAISAAVDGKKPFELEHRVVRADGSVGWTFSRAVPLFDEANTIIEWFGAASDVTERHRAEEALRASEERYRTLFQSMDEGYCIIEVLFDPAEPSRAVDYLFIEVNRAFEGQSGMHSVIGRRMLEFVERIEPHWLENYGRVALTGEAVRFAGEYTGLGRWFEVYAFRVGAPADRKIAVLFTDITSRKRAEAGVVAGVAAIDRQRRLYEAILNNTPDLAYIFGLDHRFTYANEVLLKIWGRTWDEAIGKNCLELGYEPWHASMHDREIEQVVATKQPIRGIVPFTGAFGRRLYDYIFVPVLDERGEVEAVAGTTRDVTDMRQAEAALRASEERLALAISSADLGTFYCPIPLGEILWNDTCKAHFWLPPDATIDFDRFYSIIHVDDREATRSAVERAVFGREGYDIEYRTVAPDGRQRWIRAKGRAYYDGAGNPTRFDGITLDVTEQKRIEAERERLLAAERSARADAERAGQVKDEFLATLSHELRTPLNAIVGWSQIIRASPDRAKDVAEGLEVIERNARAQTQIIEDLLDMSRILNGKLRLDVQRVELASVINEAAETVAPAAEAKEIRVQLMLDPVAGPVSGDPSRLQQVFWNLLSNSIKFSPRGGRVQVLLERINSHLEVSVIDTGEGIEPDFLPHVFDRFRQADATTTRRHGGLGLGLAIVKQLVELHGGTIRAKSPGKGQGSTFIVALPLTVVHPEAERLPERRHPNAHAVSVSMESCVKIAGAHVLVVDDEPDARALLRRLLEECDAKVTTAATGAEAFALLQRERPDVLVSDIGMPDQDGYTLIGRIRALPPTSGGRTPAIALTAYARSEDRIRAVVSGFQHHLSKPVEPAELIAMVASLFQGTNRSKG